MSTKAAAAVLFLAAAFLAASLCVGPASTAFGHERALRFTIIKRTPQCLVAKRYEQRVRVRRGHRYVIKNGCVRYRVARLTRRYAYLTRVRRPATPVTPSSTCQYGVHMDLTYNGHEWQRAKAIGAARDVLHAGISRNSLLWHRVEERKGVRDWIQTDAVVAELTSSAIEPLFVIYGSPSWANGTPESTPEHYLYVPTDDVTFEAWLSDYVAFVAEAATRYKGRVRKWEIGNEQNEHFFWKPKPDPGQYARFYTALRDVILSADPQAEVAMGGLAGLLHCSPEDITGIDFLKAMHARGIYPENVALHPYCSQDQPPTEHIAWEGNFDDVQTIYDYLQTLGRPVSIWITEWGWPIGEVTEQEQADYMSASLNMIRSQYTYVTVATAFLDYDRPSFSYGLFDADFNARPAAFAFGRFMSGMD